ncbi:glycosyltransferase family protein [Bradyrhizobium sp. OK095]|jgi:spore coat polysaccharide biosynthesis protein SpsF|uniref:cytidylyltransferase domain-containing protein n=1 Tax=Bradyrhizobium sp. OK095 TaxID=1882760 RepID=UPI0008B29C7B|nr:glycosyltransferase family protein [Bradyrhizobium sp. OK095]SEM34425.1 spore coat polysaccharide biosynthesis protein SpsF [Bradyrhizobium sp. OK095]
MSFRTTIIIQARISSSRLPGKVLKDLCGEPMLLRQIERVRACRMADQIVVATSDEASDDPVAEFCATSRIACFRGSLGNVLSRYHAAAVAFGPTEHVVRLTADCPLADPDVIDACIALHLANGADYTSNKLGSATELGPTYPIGLDVEVMTFEGLDRVHRVASDAYDLEHVTPHFYRNPSQYSLMPLRYPTDLSKLRWTVDYPADLEFVRSVFSQLLSKGRVFRWHEILDLVRANPEIAAINAAHS